MLDFTILVLPQANAASVAITLDVLSTAATVAARVGAPAPQWRIVCAGGAQAALSNGMTVAGAPLSAPAPDDKSVWVVPGLGLAWRRRGGFVFGGFSVAGGGFAH